MFVIELRYNGQKGYAREHAADFDFVTCLADATKYPTETAARCALLYIPEHCQPMLVKIVAAQPEGNQ